MLSAPGENEVIVDATRPYEVDPSHLPDASESSGTATEPPVLQLGGTASNCCSIEADLEAGGDAERYRYMPAACRFVPSPAEGDELPGTGGGHTILLAFATLMLATGIVRRAGPARLRRR